MTNKIEHVLLDMLQSVHGAGKDIYSASKEGLTKAIDFAQEQAPLVVEQFLVWKTIDASISLFGHLILAILGLVLLKKAINWYKKDDDKNDPFPIICIAFTIVFTLILTSQVFENIKEILKIQLTPKIYLLEWLTEQIQNTKNN